MVAPVRGGFENEDTNFSLPVATTTVTKEISDDVTQILNSLPNLVVMEKQYIVFPSR